MLKNNLKPLIVVLLGIFFAGCSAGKAVLKKEELDQVKKVAVVIYTVPEKIEYKEDPKAPSTTSLTKAIVKMVATGDGVKAATLAHETFSNALNEQGLSFQTLSAKQIRSSDEFAKLNKPAEVVVETKKSGFMGSVGSFVKSMTPSNRGVAPTGLAQFGLVSDWSKGSALSGTPQEKEYLAKAIEALKVDAVLAINDGGFSFVCEACVGTSASMNGAASTGSAFTATLVGRNGDAILDMREWFATTDAQAAMAMSAVNPLQQESLFKEHGKKMAIVFADFLKKSLNEGTKN